jgi:hypothetical protein
MSLLQPLAGDDICGGENEEQHRDGDKQQIEHVMPLSMPQRRVECQNQADAEKMLRRREARYAWLNIRLSEEASAWAP